MTRPPERGVIRYVLAAVVVVLLAPYAGCHIFTSPPSRHMADLPIKPSQQNDLKRDPDTTSGLSPSQRSGDEARNEASLDDIEALLGQNPSEP